ncbi:MAG TPA: hypothetical protein DCX54_08060 [Flavobacteriales bacterium]|nr:hypothetical protein [Flavobacteriales bacterium]
MRVIELVIVAIFLSLFSCIDMENDTLPEGTGQYGDLLVVMDSSLWNGETGTVISGCFSATQDGLPQREPYFNVIKITPRDFTRIFKTTRNIIIVGKEPDEGNAKYSFEENVWAKNQLVLNLITQSDKNAASILSGNCEGLRGKFMSQEYTRLQKAYSKLKNEKVVGKVEEIVGETFAIPADYVLAKTETDLIWLRKDFDQKGHQISMGLIFYRSDYNSKEQLERTWLMNKREEVTKIVEGPSPGSYMTYYKEFEPVSRELSIGKHFVKELRGLWNMENAFMGGPFVHYAFVDKTGTKIICVDGYVFAPKFDKREFLRELEAIALSALNGN